MRTERNGSNEAKIGEERPDARDASWLKHDGVRTKRSNLRIGWPLLALSTMFFAEIICSRITGDSRTGLMVLGAPVVLFLVFAIGRNTRK